MNRPQNMQTASPREIRLCPKTGILQVTFDEKRDYRIPSLLLRAFSPSADTGATSADAEKIRAIRPDVGIERIEPVGRYAVRLVFDDGHCTGIYTWEYLHELGENAAQYMERVTRLSGGNDHDKS